MVNVSAATSRAEAWSVHRRAQANTDPIVLLIEVYEDLFTLARRLCHTPSCLARTDADSS